MFLYFKIDYILFIFFFEFFSLKLIVFFVNVIFECFGLDGKIDYLFFNVVVFDGIDKFVKEFKFGFCEVFVVNFFCKWC